MLHHQKDRAWHDIVTLNECWFYFTTDHEWIWLPEGTEDPERERVTVQSRKMMMTIVWNHTGFYRIVAIPKGMKFNMDHYISHILNPLSEWRSSQVGSKVACPVDSARSHNAKKVTEFSAGNGIKRPPHRSYSPNQASCDFYLLGYIKDRLAGALFEEPDQLLQLIDGMVPSIEKATLECMFQEWTDRLGQYCVAVGGSVYGK
jgi:hypothetical protein